MTKDTNNAKRSRRKIQGQKRTAVCACCPLIEVIEREGIGAVRRLCDLGGGECNREHKP